jgi:hypothetical protein
MFPIRPNGTAAIEPQLKCNCSDLAFSWGNNLAGFGGITGCAYFRRHLCCLAGHVRTLSMRGGPLLGQSPLLSPDRRAQQEPDGGGPDEKAGGVLANNVPQGAEHISNIVIPYIRGGRVQFVRCALRKILYCFASFASGSPNGGSSAGKRVRGTSSDLVQLCAGGSTQVRHLFNGGG